MIQYQVKDDVDALSLRISDAAGRVVRELSAPESRRRRGIRTMCWDMRLEPIPALGGGGGGRGGGGGAAGAVVPGIPAPPPTAGYLPVDPCDLGDDGDGGGGGGGGGRGGAGGTDGPAVVPGIYRVALVVDGDLVDSKPLEIVMDPAVALAGAERIAYNRLTTDLHELQRGGTAMAATLNALHIGLTAAAEELSGRDDAPAGVKAELDAYMEAWDEVRTKFGVPVAAGGGGRGGGGGGGGSPSNVLARAGALKGNILSFWEPPSAALVGQYYEVKPALEAAIAEATEMLERARVLSAILDDEGISLEVPRAGG